MDAKSILFVMNKKGAKKTVPGKISKVPEKWREIMFQMGCPAYFFMVEFSEKSFAMLNDAQRIALIYHEIRKIDLNGNLRDPDVHEWVQILYGLGRYWNQPDTTCPNLLDDDVDWQTLMGSYYEQPLPME